MELGVPRATVGRRLARLEERLGVRLLRRSTRSIAPTQAGELFYRQARIALEALASAEESVRNTEAIMRGNVRVTAPPMIASSLSGMVFSFLRRYPEVRVQLDFSTRIVDLRREGYDVALRATARLEPGLIARTVARHKVIAVASPAYVATHGAPRTVKDLRRHRCLTGFARGELPESTWNIRASREVAKREASAAGYNVSRGVVHVEPAFSTNDLGVLRDAALDGAGIAMLPEILAAELLDRGALVRVLPQILEAENRLAVVHPERELVPAHVRAFIDAMVAWAPTWANAAAEIPVSRSKRPPPRRGTRAP
jgi:DNA-binding transcriptional LysR family regulator